MANITLLLRFEPGGIPVAVEQVFAREESAHFLICRRAALPRAVAHDVQERGQRWNRVRDRAVGEIALGGNAHGGNDVFHAFGKDGAILKFRTEEFLVEERAGIAEHATAERLNEARRNTPAEAA